MEPIELLSGKKLEITPAPFKDAYKLFQVVMSELEAVNISFGKEKLGKIAEMEVGDELINTLKNAVTRIAASEKIETALKPCLQRATLDNVKVSTLTFEDETSREDYLPVVKEVLWFNLRPFLKGLGSMFSQFPLSGMLSQK